MITGSSLSPGRCDAFSSGAGTDSLNNTKTMLENFFEVIAGLVLLIWGADRFVHGAGAIARNLGVAPLLIGLTVVAFATSAPEILVSIVASLRGEPGLALGMAYFAVSSTCHVVLGGPLFSGSFSLRPFFRSPLTWAVLITIAVIVSGVAVPTWIARTTTLLGDIAIPLMLLTLGVSLSKMHPESMGRSIILSFVRLGLGVFSGLFLTTLLGVDGLTRKVLVLQASMPVGVLNYLFAQRYGRSPEQVASLVLVSTLISIISIPVLLAWL